MRSTPHLYAALFAACIATFSQASAAQGVTLRLADSLPSGHVIHQVVTKPFIDEVERLSKGTIKIQHFPGEQLGKARDLLNLTQAGVIDIGYVVPAYASDKMPLSAAMELPQTFNDFCNGTRAFHALTRDGAYLDRMEFKPNKVVPIVTFMLTPYQVAIASTQNVASIQDLGKLKIRSAGGPMDFFLTSLNAVPVRMPAPEIYESLSRGTVDGTMLPYQSLDGYGITPLLKTATVGRSFGTVVLTYSMSESKWKGLPQSTRDLMTKAGADVSAESCKGFLKAENAALARAQAGGMKTIAITPADEKFLDSVSAKVATEWANGLNARGKPGTETLAAVKQAVAATK